MSDVIYCSKDLSVFERKAQISSYRNRKTSKKHKISSLKATVRKEIEIVRLFLELYRCIKVGANWTNLSSVQKIRLECHYTEQLLQLLNLGNRYVNRSLAYRLHEIEPEEEGE